MRVLPTPRNTVGLSATRNKACSIPGNRRNITVAAVQSHGEARDPFQAIAIGFTSTLAACVLASGIAFAPPADASDTAAVGGCLLRSCQTALAGCLSDITCLKNLVCLQTCNGRPDEQACQIRCGDLYEDKAVATFTCCAVSDAACVPQALTEDAYPVPKTELLDNTFDLAQFTGRWYITAGYNQLFDTFDCQEHFFSNPEPGQLFGKINWRISKPDGAFIQRSTVQKFVQNKDSNAIMFNGGNEYLHYEDTWYVAAFKPDEYALIYYKGNNDAWKGYGGATVYTRERQLPKEYIPELTLAAKNVGLKFEDFIITDNSCKAQPPTTGLVASVANEFEKDLKSFGRGFTVIESEIVKELTLEEKLIEKELAEAAQALINLEKSYEAKGWFSNFKFPFW